MGKRLPRPAVLQRFGRLRVLIPEGRRTPAKGSTAFGLAALCLCDCGRLSAVVWSNLYNNVIRSCGCLSREKSAEMGRNTATHGMCKSVEYATWASIRDRCNNPSSANYPKYGAQGVRICERWDQSFEAFYEDMGPRPLGKSANNRSIYSIERLDSAGDYEPGNCIWGTQLQQSRNRRSNVFVSINGRKMCLSEAAEHLSVSVHVVRRRRKNGWPPERWFEPHHPTVFLCD
jgi:hypothetical protein